MFINKGAFQQFEYVATRNDSAGHPRRAEISSTAPREAYVRVPRRRRRATTSPKARSTARTGSRSPARSRTSATPTTLKIGLKVSDNADAESTARFLYFRVDCSDRIAPDSTATVEPAQADGKLGWYTEPPTVDARRPTDRGAGAVDKIAYQIDDGAVQTYDDAVHGHRRRRPHGPVLRDGRRRGAQRRGGQRLGVPGRRHGARDGHRPRAASRVTTARST